MKQATLPLALLVLALSAPARAEDPTPVVHVDASSNVVLERVETDGHTTPICRAPCDRALDAQTPYQLAGDGIRPSNQFRLPEDARPVKIAMKPVSSGGFTTGVILTTLSAVFLAGGVGMLVGAVAPGSGLGSLGLSLALGAGSFVSFGVSIATGIPGIMLLANNLQSRARVMEGDMRAASRLQPTPRAPVFSIPLVSKSF